MTKRLQGRVAIVNGAGSSGPGWGNGKCTAVQFAREGAQVVVVDINRAVAEETAALIAGEGGKALALRDKGSPTGKQGTGWDTAHLAAFLASQEANYVNGLELPLDGGFTAKAPDIYPADPAARGH